MNNSGDKSVLLLYDKSRNDMFSDFTEYNLDYFINHLNNSYLMMRNKLNIPDDVKFSIGMNFRCSRFMYERDLKKSMSDIVKDNGWDVKVDRHVKGSDVSISSDEYTDELKTWSDIEKMCKFFNMTLSEDSCNHYSGKINIGFGILGNNPLYWRRFLKLWSTYENIIYRFCYGEHLSYIPSMKEKAKPVSDKILNTLEYNNQYFVENDTLLMLYHAFGSYVDMFELNKQGLNFLNAINGYCDGKDLNDVFVEFNVPVSTFDSVIWQNYINFFVHFLLYCKSDKFNDDIVNSRLPKVIEIIGDIDEYENIYLYQALELCDLIFDNSHDKIFFLRQYLKGMETADLNNNKATKYTRKREWY